MSSYSEAESRDSNPLISEWQPFFMHVSLGGGSSLWSPPLSVMQLMPYEQTMAGVIGDQGSCLAGIDIPPYE